MARRETLQTSFNAGILDPRLANQEELEAYFNGAAEIVNLRPSPQGGLMLRGGLAYLGRHRGEVTALDLAGVSITMAASGSNGGTGSSDAPPADDPYPYPDLNDWYIGPDGYWTITDIGSA